MIKNIFTALSNYLVEIQKSQEQKYLEDSSDLVDLEYRQRRITNGTAPFQRNYDHTRNYLVERY